MFSVSNYLKKRTEYLNSKLYQQKYTSQYFSIDYLNTIISQSLIVKLSQYRPLLLNEAMRIIPFISSINTSGSTSIVYKLTCSSGCYAIKVKKKEEYSAFFQNEITMRLDMINNKILTQTLFASEQDGVIMTKWIHGKVIKNMTDDQINAAFIKGLKLTMNMATEGLYDDDFTPSNIIYTSEHASLIDAGTLFSCKTENQVNPYDNELLSYNMFTRFLYKNAMVYFIRLERAGHKEKAYKIYKEFFHLFIEALDTFRNNIHGSTISNYYKLISNYYIKNYNDNILASYIRDKYLCHIFILMENLSDNYYDQNTTTRLRELISLLDDNYNLLKSRQELIVEDMKNSKEDCLNAYYKMLNTVLKKINNYDIVCQ